MSATTKRILKLLIGIGFAVSAVFVIRDAPHELDRAYANGTVPSALLLFGVCLFLSIVPSFLFLRSALRRSPP